MVLGAVIFLGVLIFLGVGALAVGITMKMRGHPLAVSAASASAGLTLPAGAAIEAMEVSGDRLILRVKTDTGEEIDIVDTGDGHVVSRVTVAPPDVPQDTPK